MKRRQIQILRKPEPKMTRHNKHTYWKLIIAIEGGNSFFPFAWTKDPKIGECKPLSKFSVLLMDNDQVIPDERRRR